MKKGYWVSTVMIAVIGAVFTNGSANAAEVNETAYTDVSAMTMWTEPDILREIDLPSASNPASLNEWTASMSVDDKLWLVGNLESQTLFGSKVHVLEKKHGWIKVAADGQETPRNELGYPGWVPEEQIVESNRMEKLEDEPFALITSPTAELTYDKKGRKDYKKLSYNTRLPVVKEQQGEVLVATPSDGNKWIDASDVEIYDSEDDIAVPDAEDIIADGKQFLGLPYLWAGMSGFGFDCSGFTHTIFAANGIEIPRDSSVQAEQGDPVAKEDLEPGDLLFFAYDNGKGRVHHVSMYIGGGDMIHSPNSRSTVEIVNLEDSGYADEYAGARRYLEE
ncbi:NlpC/P60 family protein [Marinococcus sp. PL1-022]|uniref:C40 family peptidase n=1 Tax=Marinococcus sp. PL1-022 TaxID=3095363 RepID=UPI0029C15060|nr:NlpC/P60 family protein [Marinococcus sp. PL1-022]MDX6153531.1 NlpC/P60 family protein [Marinococcus sp. PL1-022]